MNKTLFLASLILCSFGAPAIQAQTQEKDTPEFPKSDMSPLDMALARDENEQPIARIIYSRPEKRDREIFGKLVPFGDVWRTGANESTELTLYSDMMVGGETVDAGTYTLYSIPEENQWTIILNKVTHTWGAYDYNEGNDVLRTEVAVKSLQTPLESLSMTFVPTETGTKLQIGWDDQYVEVPFENPRQ